MTRKQKKENLHSTLIKYKDSGFEGLLSIMKNLHSTLIKYKEAWTEDDFSFDITFTFHSD